MDKMREDWVDVVKGVTIYLMVLGHCIQYSTSINYDFKNNEIFRLIYGFHMPLFMVISGYLFWYTLNKYDLKKAALSKLKGIIIPCFAWGLVTYICDIVIFDYKIVSLIEYIDYTVYSNWFLWAVMYCSLYGFLSRYVFKDNLAGYLFIILFNYFIPDFANYAGAKRLLPFFIMGMLICRYKLIEKIKGKALIVIIFLVSVLYVCAVWLNMSEIVTGTLGSFAVILFFYNLQPKIKLTCVAKLGQVSISVYLFTGILFYFVIKEHFRIDASYRYLIKAGYVLIMSVVLTLVAYILSRLLQKSKITSRLFLGK